MVEAETKLKQILHDVGEISPKILNEKQQRILSG